MSNHIAIEGKIYQLTDQQVEAIAGAIRDAGATIPEETKLADIAVGEVTTIAGVEFVVMEQLDGETALITKHCIEDESAFGSENNNYADSIADCICVNFANRLAETIGAENILEHDVDLIALTGDKVYGGIRRHASLLTLARYQKHLDVLDYHKVDDWWWLATASATKRHGNERWVLCVSPSGFINNDLCYFGGFGVRPFCILKSDIFVSG